jgi:hypothetical protein
MPEFQKIDTQKHQRLTGGPRPILEERYGYMLGQELIRITPPRFFLGIDRQNPLCPLC